MGSGHIPATGRSHCNSILDEEKRAKDRVRPKVLNRRAKPQNLNCMARRTMRGFATTLGCPPMPPFTNGVMDDPSE